MPGRVEADPDPAISDGGAPDPAGAPPRPRPPNIPPRPPSPSRTPRDCRRRRRRGVERKASGPCRSRAPCGSPRHRSAAYPPRRYCRIGGRVHERTRSRCRAVRVRGTPDTAVCTRPVREAAAVRPTAFTGPKQPEDAGILVRDDIDLGGAGPGGGAAEEHAAVARRDVHRVLQADRREDAFVVGREQSPPIVSASLRREMRTDILDTERVLHEGLGDLSGRAASASSARLPSRSSGPDVPRSARSAHPSRDRRHTATRSWP